MATSVRGVTDMKNGAKISSLFAPLVLGLCVWAHPQVPVPTTKNYIRHAQEFLGELYPNLRGKGYLSIEASQRNDEIADQTKLFTIYIGAGPKGFVIGSVNGNAVYAEQYLTANFEFSFDGRLIEGVGNRHTFFQVAENDDSWTTT